MALRVCIADLPTRLVVVHQKSSLPVPHPAHLFSPLTGKAAGFSRCGNGQHVVPFLLFQPRASVRSTCRCDQRIIEHVSSSGEYSFSGHGPTTLTRLIEQHLEMSLIFAVISTALTFGRFLSTTDTCFSRELATEATQIYVEQLTITGMCPLLINSVCRIQRQHFYNCGYTTAAAAVKLTTAEGTFIDEGMHEAFSSSELKVSIGPAR